MRELRRTTFQNAFEQLQPLFPSPFVGDLTGTPTLVIALNNPSNAACVDRKNAVRARTLMYHVS
jgi:hypothetical protein